MKQKEEISKIKAVIIMLDQEIKQTKKMNWINLVLILGVLILVITTL